MTFGRKPTRIENIIVIIFDCIIWSFITSILVYVSVITIRENDYSIALFSVTFIIFISLCFWRNFVNLNTFFPVEISGKFIVFLRPMGKRKVYDLALIKDLNLFWNYLFFRYNGWPVLMPLSIKKEQRHKLMTSIELANKKRNEMDGSNEPPIR